MEQGYGARHRLRLDAAATDGCLDGCYELGRSVQEIWSADAPDGWHLHASEELDGVFSVSVDLGERGALVDFRVSGEHDDSCFFAYNGECEDGWICAAGTDCSDCGNCEEAAFELELGALQDWELWRLAVRPAATHSASWIIHRFSTFFDENS